VTDLRNAIIKEFPFDDLFDSLVASHQRSRVRTFRVDDSARLARPAASGSAARGWRDAAACAVCAAARAAVTQRADTRMPPLSAHSSSSIESGEVVEISTELVLSAAAVAQATEKVKGFVASMALPPSVSCGSALAAAGEWSCRCSSTSTGRS
jgi:hypothetical protein